MDRALQGVPYTARQTIYSGSTAVNPTPDVATIEVRRADGTVVVPAGTATVNDAGTGVFAYTLNAAAMSLLDVLELRWTITSGGEQISVPMKTYVEVVGGFLCTLAELKVAFPADTDTALASRRTRAEQRLESACNQAFVPRYDLQEFSGWSRRFRLRWPNVRALRYAESHGLPVPIGYLSVSPGNFVTGIRYSHGVGLNVVRVGYEHGHSYVPESIREAVTLVAQEIEAADGTTGAVVRREADRQAITYASPTGSSDARFENPTLRNIVRDNKYHLIR